MKKMRERHPCSILAFDQSKVARPAFALRNLVACFVTAMSIASPSLAETAADKTANRIASKVNAAAVKVEFRLEGEPATGAETALVIVLTPVAGGGPATARFSADAGLQLKGAPMGEVPLEASGSTTIRLTVVPEAVGLRYVNVFTSQNGAMASRSIAIPAGKPPPRGSGGNLKTAPDGERVLSQPVR
ncbi:hypothetical protein QTH91_20395 [Variovorax dokdonensis]|uniref:Uncharacterized protein n=1 Tax=Variovorax dokdonensis TaxID=344883 RepID=A0ABT7NG02_9BURK|nr:hypothetical protein [Variovorax dokdonensis]MDM0046863.1 hypothetical protein [Variovorax dokdonensis]